LAFMVLVNVTFIQPKKEEGKREGEREEKRGGREGKEKKEEEHETQSLFLYPATNGNECTGVVAIVLQPMVTIHH